MNVRYLVTLAAEEKSHLEALVSGGMGKVRHVKRAQILLAAHGGATDEQIASSVRVGVSTVYRVKRRFVEGGVELRRFFLCFVSVVDIPGLLHHIWGVHGTGVGSHMRKTRTKKNPATR